MSRYTLFAGDNLDARDEARLDVVAVVGLSAPDPDTIRLRRLLHLDELVVCDEEEAEVESVNWIDGLCIHAYVGGGQQQD